MVAVVVTAVLASGCALVELSPQAQEDVYLLRVAEAESHWLQAIDRFDQALSSSYSTRNAFIGAVIDAGLEDGAADALQAAEALDPPASLVADHANWLRFRSAVVDLEPRLTPAVASGDSVAILEVRRAFGEVESEFLLSIGRTFCVHLLAVNPAEDCPPDDSLPGGGYGRDAHQALREYALRAAPLFFTSPGLSPNERSSYLAAVQPDLEALLAEAGIRLTQLTPPPELAPDHQALLSYFDAQHATAVAITAANAVGDDARILELYDESAAHFEQLQEALSDAVRPIVDPAF